MKKSNNKNAQTLKSSVITLLFFHTLELNVLLMRFSFKRQHSNMSYNIICIILSVSICFFETLRFNYNF